MADKDDVHKDVHDDVHDDVHAPEGKFFLRKPPDELLKAASLQLVAYIGYTERDIKAIKTNVAITMLTGDKSEFQRWRPQDGMFIRFHSMRDALVKFGGNDIPGDQIAIAIKMTGKLNDDELRELRLVVEKTFRIDLEPGELEVDVAAARRKAEQVGNN